MVESEISTKEMIKTFKMEENQSNNVCVVILKVDNKEFNLQTKSCDIRLFGKTMTEWVANAVFDADIRYADYNFGEDFLTVVKLNCNPQSKYTCVFFSDTPLLERKTYLQIMEYFKTKSLNALKLTRGYVFKTDFLMTIDQMLTTQTQYFEEEDFITCYNLKQTAMVRDVLKTRIQNYFMKNGVDILDLATTFVDADVQIGADTIICPFVNIQNGAIIEKNVRIGSNTRVSNSVVCQNSKLDGCTIINSFVCKNCNIGKGAIVKNNAKIEDDIDIPPYAVIDGVVVDKNSKIKSFMHYKGRED